MTSERIQSLLEAATCFRCYGVQTESELVQVSLWLEYLANLDATASTDPNALYAVGKNYACYGPMTNFQIILLGIMNLIARALDSAADTSPGRMLVSGMNVGCFGASIEDIVEVALMDQILATA